MTKRNSKLYDAIMQTLRELCPNLKFVLYHAVADFELSVEKTMKNVFPNCQMHGCWFHSKKVQFLNSFFYTGSPTRTVVNICSS